MNAKKCKALRSAARQATIGKPAVQYIASKANPRTYWVHPHSTRGVYLELKSRLNAMAKGVEHTSQRPVPAAQQRPAKRVKKVLGNLGSMLR